MKTTKTIIVVGMLAGALNAGAQTSYDAARFMDNDLNGTARFVGMGGAMGALGGDISVIGTNPAGIGIFRSNDVALSFGFNNTAAKSTFNGVSMNQDRTRASFDQIGFVYSNKIGNTTSLRFVNFGFNYHKSKNLNKLFEMGGNLDGFSQSWQIAGPMSDGIANEQDFIDLVNAENPYTSRDWGNISTLAKMAARNGVIDWSSVDNAPVGRPGKSNYYRSDEKGGISQYDFNVAFNVEDRFYFGATLGVYDVNYTRFSTYTEDLLTNEGADDGGYTLTNNFRTEGTGIDLKLGAIIRPFENSPFRLGLAVHTPTWYNLTDTYSAYMESSIGSVDNGEVYYQDTYAALGGNYVADYQLATPWKFNASMGTTLSGMVALGAEYEYADYSSAKVKDPDGVNLEVTNEEIGINLKGVHTLRLGIETRISSAFSIRAGYNYSTALFNKGTDIYKYLTPRDTRTDTEYNNTEARNTFTFGLGYRGSIIYADLAYKYDAYKSNFYPFYDKIDNGYLPATKVDNDRHQLLLTVGARF